MAVLRVHDTLSGKLRPVERRPGRPLGMYICGPTVYAPAHVGHARTYLYFDVVRRAFRADRVPVRHVMNITDFEEKIDRKAAALGIGWQELARREEAGFFRDLDALGILRPTFRPRASDFIARMVQVAARLEKTGRVERSDGAWYYCPPERPREENFPVSGELAEHAVPEPGHPFPERESIASRFMVWQHQEPPLPSWKGPWGPGMPGWHLECYAMAEHYLGVPVDLHGGGLDLVYPHHHAENEIALALNRRPFSRCFVHTAFVLQNGRKMSKSTQNLVSIQEALAESGAASLRWYLLRPRYSERLAWDPRELGRARDELDRVRSAIRDWLGGGAGGRIGAKGSEKLLAGVRADIANDVGTHAAIERVREFAAGLEAPGAGSVARGERAAARRAITEVEARLGIPLH